MLQLLISVLFWTTECVFYAVINVSLREHHLPSSVVLLVSSKIVSPISEMFVHPVMWFLKARGGMFFPFCWALRVTPKRPLCLPSHQYIGFVAAAAVPWLIVIVPRICAKNHDYLSHRRIMPYRGDCSIFAPQGASSLFLFWCLL